MANTPIDFGTHMQGSQETISFTWPLSSDISSPTNFTGFTVTGVMQDKSDSSVVTAIDGTLTVVTGATRAITWAMSANDCGTAGQFIVILKATDGTDTVYTLQSSIVFQPYAGATAVAGSMLTGISSAEASWVTDGYATVPDGTTLIPDANSDGTTYGRLNGAWAAIASGGDVGDLTTATGTSGQMVRVAAAGGLEYRSTAQVLSDIGAETSGAAATAQAFAIQRSNHTGTQLLSTISDAGTMAAASTANYYAKTDFSANPTASEPILADGAGGLSLNGRILFSTPLTFTSISVPVIQSINSDLFLSPRSTTTKSIIFNHGGTTVGAIDDAYIFRSNPASGTVTDGYGAGITFQLSTNPSASQTAGRISASWDAAAQASRSSKIAIQAAGTSGLVSGIEVDDDATAGNTRLLLYDVDNATVERVTVGAADSGGAGYKVLRIPN